VIEQFAHELVEGHATHAVAQPAAREFVGRKLAQCGAKPLARARECRLRVAQILFEIVEPFRERRAVHRLENR